ncbi:hypothetical protein C5964_19285 [Cronobacter sakazakii]|nr:hypothetical protein C5964_19285 [Cronobacter sakazakii]
MTGQTRFNGEAVGGTFTPTLRAGIVAPAAWACKPLWGLMDVRRVRCAYPPYENPIRILRRGGKRKRTHLWKMKSHRRCRVFSLAAALWPRAGMVKGAAASPLNTFA